MGTHDWTIHIQHSREPHLDPPPIVLSSLERDAPRWLAVHLMATDGTIWTNILVRPAKSPSDGRLICTGLVVGAFGEEELTVRRLRSLPLAQILETLGRADHEPVLLALFPQGVPEFGPRVKPGPKGHPNVHFEQIADAYRAALGSAPRSPMKTLTHAYNKGRPQAEWVSEVTVRRWVQRARDKGFLGESPLGKAGSIDNKKRRRT